MFPESRIEHSPTPTAKVRSRWRTGLVGLVLSLWLGWAGYLLWLGSQANQLPLDWHGLWDADSSPRLHPNLLGVQVLFEGASIEMAEGNRAFSLPPRGTVLLGKWSLPSVKNRATFAAWVKLEAAPPNGGLVAMAGITPPGEWGFGAWDGHPAAWFPKVTRPNTGIGRLVAPDPWRVGRWTHLAVVTSPNRVSFWLDGQRVASSSSEWAHPSWAEVALGRAPDFLSLPRSVTPKMFGLTAPPFLIDDFTVYARSLSDAEIRQTAKAGRGGLTRAQALLERQARIARPGTFWIALSGLLLIGACVWRDASRGLLAGGSLLTRLFHERFKIRSEAEPATPKRVKRNAVRLRCDQPWARMYFEGRNSLFAYTLLRRRRCRCRFLGSVEFRVNRSGWPARGDVADSERRVPARERRCSIGCKPGAHSP